MTKWVVDPDHSVAAFSIRHMMIANVRGQFNKITGIIYFDPSDIAGSSVEITIDVASIVTGIKKRDDHLRSADFFDVENYPFITFKSTEVKPVDEKHAKIAGNLTIHGITRPMSFDVEASGPAKDPFGSGMSMGFTAEAAIDREEFDIKWNEQMENGGVMAAKEVYITIDIEADLAE